MKQMFTLLVYGICILGLLVAIVFAHRTVYSLWEEVARRQALLQDVPAQTSRTAVLKKDLDTALVSMEAINATVPNREELVGVVSAISAAALASGVSAQVPQVQPNIPASTASPDEQFAEVRIRVVASGRPSALALFLYKIEHLPYILHAAAWKIDTLTQTAVTSFSGTAPVDAPQASPAPGSSLEADITVLTTNSKL